MSDRAKRKFIRRREVIREMNHPKFAFYEYVKVISPCTRLPAISGREGAILGMSRNEETHNWVYSVHILGDESWFCFEHELISNGRIGKREDFYSGESIRVNLKGQASNPEKAD
jgi:hypothetical protein